MTPLFDTHCHLDLLKSQSDVLSSIETVPIYVISMTNLPDIYLQERDLFQSKYIRLALGFHPELIFKYQKQIPLMWNLMPSAKYIGEIGLDFKAEGKKEQISFFEKLINICREDNRKILSIHSRGATSEVLAIIGERYMFHPILHWFSGKQLDLEKAVERGFYFSINKSMLRSSKFTSLLPSIPIDRLLIESDAPFIKIKGNIENTLDTTIGMLSALLHKDIEDVKNILWRNFKMLLYSAK